MKRKVTEKTIKIGGAIYAAVDIAAFFILWHYADWATALIISLLFMLYHSFQIAKARKELRQEATTNET